MNPLTRMVGFLSVTDAERSRAFYENVLQFRFDGDDGFALLFDAEGTRLRLNKVEAFVPARGTVLGWEVDDVEEAVHALVARGVSFQRYDLPFMQQDENGIWTAPDGSRVAWFNDPDGNVLSISSHPPR